MTHNKIKKNSVISNQLSVISSAALRQKGFTLIELIIYIGIFAVAIAVGAQLLSVTSRIRSQTEARYEVQQNIRFAADKIFEYTRKASSLITDVPSDELELIIGAENVDFEISDGILQVREGAGAWQNLTTDLVAVSAPAGNFIFNPVINTAPAKPTIQIKLKVSYNDFGRPDFVYETEMQTTVSLR